MIITIKEEDIERIERQLNHLDKLSVKYWKKSEEAENAGDAAGRVKYIAKSDRIDEKQYGILFCLDALGFTWKTDLGFDGCDKFTIYQPGTRR